MTGARFEPLARGRARQIAVSGLLMLGVTLSLWARGIGEDATRDLHGDQTNSGEDRGFAVVELYTSEGCSSCPPADAVFGGVVADAEDRGRPVYAIAWHVDYWDYLGWVDPYGSDFASRRQREYASALSDGVYTPQLIVNGRLVASNAANAREIESLIGTAVLDRSSTVVAIRAAEVANGHLAVRYDVDSMPGGSDVLLVVVERGLVQQVNAGENAGRMLVHQNVARAYAVMTEASGETRIALPDDLEPESSSLIAIVQDTRSMRIVSAAVRPLAVATASLSGRIVSNDGSVAASRRIYLCSDTVCVPGVTDATGAFLLEHVPPGAYDLKVDSTDSSAVTSVLLVSGQTSALSAPLVAR